MHRIVLKVCIILPWKRYKMLRDILTAVRPREDLLLGDGETGHRVSSQIVQYLWPHQLDGVRRLYGNFAKRTSTILNDSDRSGKRFQCTAFLDAILRPSNDKRILILCNDTASLNKWHFHIASLLDTAIVRLSDQQSLDALQADIVANVLLSTVELAAANVHVLMQYTFETMVVEDPLLRLDTSTYDQLITITALYTIYITGADLTMRLANLYDLLKFCKQTSLLSIADEPDKILTKSEFLAKYKYTTAAKNSDHAPVARQLQALDAYSDLIIRRTADELRQISAKDHETFQKAFDSWLTSNNWTSSKSKVISAVATAAVYALTQHEDEEAAGTEPVLPETNVAYNYETQMSPLIYSNTDSDNDADEPNAINEIIPSSQVMSSTCSTLMPGSQESASSTADEIIFVTQRNPQPQAPFNSTHRTGDKDRSFDGSASKRSKYRTLDIQTNSKSVTRQRGRGGRRSSTEWPSLIAKSQRIVCTQSDYSVSSPDVQIISDRLASPITVTSSSCENGRSAQAAAAPCVSPDLFTSYESGRNRSEPVADALDHESDNETPPFDLALSESVNNDIFEITRNNVFGSVLCSAADRITPVKAASGPARNDGAAGPCCLSGIRVLIPAISDADKRHEPSTTCQFDEALTSTQNSVVVVDSQEANDVVLISSEESPVTVAAVELTPKNRKLQLTPSTRSCLKRRSDEATDRGEAEGDSRRSKWMSTKRPTCGGTPESRRRLQRWLNRTSPSRATGQSPTSSRPRNLNASFAVLECRPTRPVHFNINSPNIFSDDEL